MRCAKRTDEEPEPLDGGHDGHAAHVGAEDVDDCKARGESRGGIQSIGECVILLKGMAVRFVPMAPMPAPMEAVSALATMPRSSIRSGNETIQSA